MDETTFQSKLSELMAEISGLPAEEQAKLQKVAEDMQEHQQQINKSAAAVQLSAQDVLLGSKYLIFDLEATRREKTMLLEENGKLERENERFSRENKELAISCQQLATDNDRLRRLAGEEPLEDGFEEFEG